MAPPTTSPDGDDLRSALAKGNVVLFVGAGLSTGAGLPGWPALVRPLAQSLGYRQFPADDEQITTDHLISAAQHYENQRGRNKLIEHLREKLDATGKRPTAVHQSLASWPVRIIFTTNFDDLVEQALREAGRRFNRVVATEELAFGNPDEVQVVKLCGELDRPASIVFTRDDYNSYLDKHPRLAERLRTTLESHTALFLGYSLQDPFLNQIWAKIGLDFGKLQRHAFAVTFGVSGLEAEDLRRRGIHVIDPSEPGMDKNQSLEAWLRCIAPEGSRTSALQVGVITTLVPALIPRPPVVGFVARRDRQGRDILARLGEELAPQRSQLVALWGGGGVGKTTLAAEAARAWIAQFGPRLVWAGAERRADFTFATLLDEIATQLDRADLGPLALEPKKEHVRALLAERPALMVLDNFETVAPGEQRLCAEWLAEGAPSPALLTTRDSLTFKRGGVDIASNVGIDAMAPEEACDFLERLVARTGNPAAFAGLDRDRVIRAADANPLVMQWIVAQIDLAQAPATVLEELTRGKGDAAERVFDRSFNLPQLGDDGRATLLALSLFVPSASRQALAEVAGFGEEVSRVNEAVKQVAALRLVSTTDEGKRLAVQGLTRELASARLAGDPRAGEFRRRFVAFFLHYAEGHAKAAKEDYDALEAEKDNVLGAMDLAFQSEDWRSVAAVADVVANPVSGMLSVRGYWEDALRQGNRALEAARRSSDDRAVARFAHNTAIMFQNRGDLEQARRLYNESLEIKRKLGNQGGIAISLHQLGRLAQDQGNVEEARRLYNESLEIERKLGNQGGIASSLHQLGRLAQDQGNVEEARRLYNESLEINRKLGDQGGIAISLHQLGMLAQNEGSVEAARRLYGESLEIKRKLGNQGGIASSLHQLGRLAQDQGNVEEARRLYNESLEIKRKLGNQGGIASSLHQLGRLAEDQGNVEEARRLYGESLEIKRKLGNQGGIARGLHQLGSLAEDQGDKAEAARLFREALAIFEKLKSPNAEIARRSLESVSKAERS